MLSVLEIIKKTTDFFVAKGVENPRLNAELIVGHGLGLKRMQLYVQFERLLANRDSRGPKASDSATSVSCTASRK